MIVGFRSMRDAFSRGWHARVSSEGALWILALNGILLVPLVFAAFFYPGIVLAGVGAFLLLTLGLYEVLRFAHTHHVADRLRRWVHQ